MSHKPERHHYSFAVIISLIIILIAGLIYYFTSFSSIRQTIVELENLDNIKSAYYFGDENKLVVTCANNKEIQIVLEDSLERYTPVVSDFCR